MRHGYFHLAVAQGSHVRHGKYSWRTSQPAPRVSHFGAPRVSFSLVVGTVEIRRAPRKRSGKEIDMLLTNWDECPPPGKKQKALPPLLTVWKTRSIFWDLPIWKILETPHSLDVMHITKNVCESLLGTLLNMPERTKDGPKARSDLRSLGIRKDL